MIQIRSIMLSPFKWSLLRNHASVYQSNKARRSLDDCVSRSSTTNQ